MKVYTAYDYNGKGITVRADSGGSLCDGCSDNSTCKIGFISDLCWIRLELINRAIKEYKEKLCQKYKTQQQ